MERAVVLLQRLSACHGVEAAGGMREGGATGGAGDMVMEGGLGRWWCVGGRGVETAATRWWEGLGGGDGVRSGSGAI